MWSCAIAIDELAIWAQQILEFIFRQGLRYRHADVKEEEKHHTQLMDNLAKMLKKLR